MPRRIVATMPMLPRPGTSSRAIAPAMSPTITRTIMNVTMNG
jgi:hypothetical protein